MHKQLNKHTDMDEIAGAMVPPWMDIATAAIEKNGRFTLALSGGKTPIPALEILSKQIPTEIWDKTHIFLTDERFVPHEHEDSNYRMLERNLIRKLGTSSVHAYPIKTFLMRPEDAASDYEALLKHFFTGCPEPAFDLILLGMGDDGHTGSLFPQLSNIDSETDWVTTVRLDTVRHPRISLTLPIINAGSNVWFLVTGENKADRLKEVVEDDTSRLPAALVNPETPVTFFIDHAAASKLTQ